jgi:hypothetical protein
MAQSKAKLYQRLRTQGFPWEPVREFLKNGNPKLHPRAFQFGVRCSLNGKRRLDPAATLDLAIARLKDRQVRILAAQNGVTLPDAPAPTWGSRNKLAEAKAEYLTAGKAYTVHIYLRCYCPCNSGTIPRISVYQNSSSSVGYRVWLLSMEIASPSLR